jgi:hypothetical protein
MNDSLIDAFDDCLRAMEAGATLDAALARYPRLAAELRPMLLAARIAQPAEPIRVPRQSEEASHARFMARAQQLRRTQPRVVRGWWKSWVIMPRLAFAALALVLAGFGVVSASASSLPGDALYGVKRTVERAQLSFTPAEGRASLEQEFERRRVEEVKALVQQGREATIEVSFRGVVEQQGEPSWVISGVRVVVPQPSLGKFPNVVGKVAEVTGELRSDGLVYASQLNIIDPGAPPQPTLPRPTRAPTETNTPEPSGTPLPTFTSAPSQTLAQTAPPTQTSGHGPSPSGTLLPPNTPRPTDTQSGPSPSNTPHSDETPEPEEVEFEGILQSTDPWTVNGQVFTVNAETEFRNNPQVGDNVEVKAYRLNDGTLLARRIEKK